MNNLIKKSEIGLIFFTEPRDLDIVRRYEVMTGSVLEEHLVAERQDGAPKKSVVAYKISDIAKVLEISEEEIKRRLGTLRYNFGELAEVVR
jgi:hypothetical protein